MWEVSDSKLVWNKNTLSLNNCVVTLSSEALEEIKKISLMFETIEQLEANINVVNTPILKREIEWLKHRFLLDGPGFFILDGLVESSIPQEKWKMIFRLYMHAFGDTIMQDGNLTIKEVKNRGLTIEQGGHYSDGKFGGGLHTDGAEYPMPVPEVFPLMCVQQGVKGGEFQVISAYSVHQVLQRENPQALEVLYKPFHVDLKGHMENGKITTQKPVFFRYGVDNKKIGFTYLRKYVDAGHAYAEVPDLTSEQEAALNALDKLIVSENNPLVVEGHMKPGQCVFVNNLMIIHGRKEFEDGDREDQKRLLLRSWIRERDPALQCPVRIEY